MMKLTQSYTSIYTTALGADPVIHGSINNVSSTINMLISMPSRSRSIALILELFKESLYVTIKSPKHLNRRFSKQTNFCTCSLFESSARA